MLQAIAAGIVALGTKSIVGAAARFVAFKLVIWGTMTVILPIVLFNVWIKVQKYILKLAMDQIGEISGVPQAMIQLTGYAAWFADQLKLTQVVMILLSGALTAWTLRRLKL